MISEKSKKHAARSHEMTNSVHRTGVALSTSETVNRIGAANAEFLKGYNGIDNETGHIFTKSLKGISQGKVHPDYANENLKQQAGYSAEVAATSRDNAEAIINGTDIRTARSDDLPQYGRNHNVVDRVKVLNGEVIEGSQTQMKFIGDRDELFGKIAREDGKFSRYLGIKLELPSEQFEGAKEFCQQQAQKLRENALAAEQQGRPSEVVAKLRREADNYDQLANDVADSGLTTDDALFYRKHPKIATVRDIGRTSHRAGMEGAKNGAIIGSVILLMQNALAVAQERKELGGAVKDVAIGTAKAAALGYGTAFAGSAIKGVMQQSGSHAVRQLANTSAPTLALNICLSLGGSIKRYVQDEIDETQLLAEVGEQGAGMLSSAMMAALGQLVIPVPVVGAAIGGMIGYTLSSLFYQTALDAGRQADAAQAWLTNVRKIESAARERIAQERSALEVFVRQEFPELERETRQLFTVVETIEGQGVEAVAVAINSYAELLGAQLQFKSLAEFDAFMATDQPLTL